VQFIEQGKQLSVPFSINPILQAHDESNILQVTLFNPLQDVQLDSVFMHVAH